MTWTGSTRRARLPKDWTARRLLILDRDGHRCTNLDEHGHRCTQRATEVDHVERGDDHGEHNLASLCGWHHGRKTAAEANAARWTKDRTTRPAERHPGLA